MARLVSLGPFLIGHRMKSRTAQCTNRDTALSYKLFAMAKEKFGAAVVLLKRFYNGRLGKRT